MTQNNNTRQDTPWHNLDVSTALKELKSSLQGLDADVVEKRLSEHGANLPSLSNPPGLIKRFFQKLNDRFIYILLIAAVLTAVLQMWLDSAIIFIVILLTAIVGLVQEGRTQKTLATIQDMLSPTARALRADTRANISADQLVPGDVILLQAGDQVPADARLFDTNGLQVDESILVGESSPTLKGSVLLEADTGLADRINMVYAGTTVVSGHARGVVVNTGKNTQFGRINTLLENPLPSGTPLNRQLRYLMNVVLAVLLIAAVLVMVYGLLTPGMQGHTVKGLLLSTSSLVVAAVPAGLPTLFAIILGVSVNRLAASKVVARSPAAIENLGAVSVICADKNSLTRQELIVQKVVTTGGTSTSGKNGNANESISDSSQEAETDSETIEERKSLIEAAVLSSDAMISADGEHALVQGDPLESALANFAIQLDIDPTSLRENHQRVASIPFDRTYRYMATLHRTSQDAQQIYVKGAPEAILSRCSKVFSNDGLANLEQAVWDEEVKMLASQGMKTLVIATKQVDKPIASITHDDVGYGLTLLGIIGLTDSPRKDATQAIKLCREAGIGFKILTGDHSLTARTLGAEVGIEHANTALTGDKLDEIDDAELAQAIKETDIFARISPAQKLRLITAFQHKGEHVAMLGSGVNDMPAMKQADIGIAIDETSTEAARQSADIVLRDKAFPALSRAILEGRTSHLNFQKIVQYMVPSNSAQALTIILAVLFGMALPLMPLQVLWVNLLIAGLLAITLAFEKTESTASQPNSPMSFSSLFSGFLVWRLILVSAILLISTLGIFIWELDRGETLEAARTAAVNALVFAQIFYLLSVRHSTQPGWKLSHIKTNRWVIPAIILVLILQLLFTYWSPLSHLLGTSSIDGWAWLWILVAGSLVFLVVEVEKAIHRNAEGWWQSATLYVLRHFDPRFWKEKGLRWTIQFFAVLFLVSQLVLTFFWTREPDTFDVIANARQMVNATPEETLRPGVITTATLTHIANTMLDKSGGYTNNDRLPPGVILEHLLVVPDMPNWEFGVLTQVRDMSLAMRDDMSRSQSQSAADSDLVTAQIRFNTDSDLWVFPPAETQFREGVDALESYLQRLQNDQAQFYIRADNLNSWLAKVQRQMGTLTIALSSSVGIRQIRDENAFMASVDMPAQPTTVEGAEIIEATKDANEVIVKTPRLKVDDIFYQARGQTWAILHLLKAIEKDFEDVLRQKNALVSLRQIINKLEDTQQDISSPIILNGESYSFVANHSLVMTSQISRANAALIDLGNLLREG